MATLCKNCGGPLIFKPEINRMFCNHCGTDFAVSDVEITDRELLEEIKALSAKEVYGVDSEEFYDCNVYTCNQCGGEVIVNNTEVSTYCIYCGNPTVVFNRVAKQKRPEFILPFSISKDTAVSNIRSHLSRGSFVPKELKNFKPDMVRGIYIPYWIVNCEHYNAAFIRGELNNDKDPEIKYYERVGTCTFNNMPLDASLLLNDETSVKLEPFDLKNLVPFDENYLSGFYSDMSDVSTMDITRAANSKADEMFREEAMHEIFAAKNKEVLESSPYTKLTGDKVYVMFPAWFITLEYQGEPLTILVNGDSGKVVGTLPFNKKKFIALTTIESVLLGLVFAVVVFLILSAFMSFGTGRTNARINTNMLKLIVPGIGMLIATFKGAINRLKRIKKNLTLTKSTQTLRYVKKRQG